MIDDRTDEPVHEVVGIFHDPEDLQSAIDDLLSESFDRAELSLLAGEHTVEKKLGHKYRRVTTLEDDPAVPRTAYVSTEAVGDAEGGLVGGLLYVGATVAATAVVATGGTIAAAIAAAAVAGSAGGLIGSVLAGWVGHHHAEYLEDQIERGGLLLWVRTPVATDVARAVEILKRHCGDNVHVHGMPVPA
jgi:hypothetical protein